MVWFIIMATFHGNITPQYWITKKRKEKIRGKRILGPFFEYDTTMISPHDIERWIFEKNVLSLETNSLPWNIKYTR